LRWQAGVRWAGPGLGAGLGVTLLLVWLGRFYPLGLPMRLLAVGLAVTLLSLLGLLLYSWLRPLPLLTVARRVDRRLNLAERLSTSLELAAGQQDVPRPIVEAQLTDTVQHLKNVEAGHTFPIVFPRRWIAVSAVLAGAIIAGLVLPNPQVQALQQQAHTQAVIDEQRAQLEEIQAELLADEALLETPQGETLLQSLDELIEILRANDLSPEEALAAISAAEQELAGLQEAAARQEAGLNDLARRFSQFDSTADLAAALQQRDLAAATEALTSAGDTLAADPQAAQELAEALRQAAEAAQQSGNTELAETLAEATAAVQQAASQEGGDPQAAQEALRQAAEALAEAGEQLANQDVVEQALGNIQEARQQLAEATGTVGAGPGRIGIPRVEGDVTGGSGREDPTTPAEGLTAETGAPDRMSTANGPNQGRTGQFESQYPSIHLGGEGGPIVNPEPQGAQGGLPIGEAPVDPNQDPGVAQVPYDQVYGQYNDAASQALEDSYIPLGMKGYVRQYFGALEPGNEK
jgi:hypothetical protein